MPLARGTRQILENTEFILLYSLMFEIDSFSFVLLLIDDWQLVMPVNICQSFIHQSFVAAFSPKFLLPKLFTVRYSVNSKS